MAPIFRELFARLFSFGSISQFFTNMNSGLVCINPFAPAPIGELFWRNGSDISRIVRVFVFIVPSFRHQRLTDSCDNKPDLIDPPPVYAGVYILSRVRVSRPRPVPYTAGSRCLRTYFRSVRFFFVLGHLRASFGLVTSSSFV